MSEKLDFPTVKKGYENLSMDGASIHQSWVAFSRGDLLRWFFRGGLKINILSDSPNVNVGYGDV